MLFTPIKPMLLIMGKDSFDDDNYIFEPKWDGWRAILHKDGDHVEVFTKRGRRITDKFPEAIEAARSIRSHSAIVDCEAVVIRDDRPNFDDISYRGRLTDPRRIARATVTHPVSFVAFDVLHADRDTTGETLMQRKELLADIISPSPVIMPTMYVEGQGKALHQLTIDRDLEGIVAKEQDSRYLIDRAGWTKIKNFKLIDTVILGYRVEPTFALIVGLHFPTVQNKPVAVVEYGFSPDEKRAFRAIAKDIHTYKKGSVQWIEPRLCCRIQYQDRTDTHNLRITSFKGFLFDKQPEECKWVS